MTTLTKMINGECVPLTEEEIVEFEAREAAHAQWIASEAYAQQAFRLRNFDILKQLEEIDLKSIRAIRSNDTQRLAELEAQASALRLQFI